MPAIGGVTWGGWFSPYLTPFILAFLAALLAVEPQPGMLDEAGRREALPRATTALIRDGEISNSHEAVGYTARDVPAPGRGDAQAVAPLPCAPRGVGAAERELILRDSMRHWS